MSINTAYYGQENSWLSFPPVTGMTDPFKTGQYSNVNISAYGNSTRTWLACKYGDDISTYKQPLDMSFGWCITDGTAPFDSVYGVTGFNGNHDRYELNQNGKSVIGLGAKGEQYLTNIQHVQYYKNGVNGSAVWGNVPLNFQPDYSFSPDIENNAVGLRILKCANSGLSPALKFDFGHYYLVPIIDYYVLKNTATIADWDNVTTDPVDYNNLIASNGYKRDDLYSFYERVKNGTYNADKIIINGVAGFMVHVAWHDDETYNDGDISFGSQTETTCSLNLIHANNTPVDFTFSDWYDPTDPKQHNVKIDTVFINNRGFATGRTGIYHGKPTATPFDEGQFNTQTAILMSGTVLHQGTGFTMPTVNCYEYQTVAMSVTDYTVKRFTNSALPKSRKNSIAIYATLADFGGLDSFREYVRKCCAYFGCLFSEKYYPNATQDWLESDCFIGTIDESGITHGAYTHGADNANQPQLAWGDEWSKKTPYKPNVKPKPTPSTKEDSAPLTLRPNANIGIGMGLMRYAVKSNDLFNMGVWLNSVTNYNKAVNSFVSKYVTDNPSASENKAMKAFKNVFPDVNSWYAYVYSKLGNGVHPNNNIVGLMAFPFETSKFGVGTTTGILMGDSNTGSPPEFECKSWYEDESPVNTTFTLTNITTATGKPVNSDGFAVLEMGSAEILPEFGDFRDYAPYTKLELQIPYFGTVDLDPKEWYYHTVHVKCICECVTGSAMCIVLRDDSDGDEAPAYTIGGQVGFSIPMNIDSYGGTTASLASSSASFQNMNVEHRVNAVNGLIDVGKSTATLIGAGAFTVATGGLGVGALALAGANTAQTANSYYGQMKTEKNNIKATEYAMEHQQAGSMILGSASPSANAKYEYQCRLVKHRPVMLDTNLQDFINTNGVACNESGVVGDYSGYAVFSNVKLDNINLTDEEKKIIETTLQSGVYIK